MNAHLDHIVVVAHTLAIGAEHVRTALGQAPGPGRRHPHMGTHNLLLSLGGLVYLEVVAVDPDAPPVSRPRWFGLDGVAGMPPARLAAWVARTDDIQASGRPELGAVETMQREGASWQMTSTSDGRPPLAGAGPLLIQRATAVHPAALLPQSGLRLRELQIRHPAPEQVRSLLSRIGLAATPAVSVSAGAACALVAAIETPSGLRTLGGD